MVNNNPSKNKSDLDFYVINGPSANPFDDYRNINLSPSVREVDLNTRVSVDLKKDPEQVIEVTAYP